ncbi:MAG: 50S ribosomal protein L6, partial [Bacilli bacterium]
MSRIGNKAITIPAGVEVSIASGNEVTVKGPKGTLARTFDASLEIVNDAGIITVKRPNDLKLTRQIHGTTRSLLYNMIVGVSEGFSKTLELVGIGYRAQVNGNKLTL